MRPSAPRPVFVTALVAGLVAVVAFVAVAVMRIQRSDADAADRVGPPVRSDHDAAATCGKRPCEVLTSVPVGRTTVELLADVDGQNGRLRVRGQQSEVVLETALAGMDVKVTQRSLVCIQGPSSACLVRGRHSGGVAGEVFVGHNGSWTSAEQPYFSDAGYIDLLDVTGDKSPEIGVARQHCGHGSQCGGPVVVEVYGLNGVSIGCTTEYSSLTLLPEWPDVELHRADLRKCA